MPATTSMTTFCIMLFAMAFFLLSVAALPIEAHNGTDVEKRTSYTNSRFTYFYEGGYGACGGKNKDSDYVVALNHEQWEGGKHCYKKINISYNGKHTQASIVDMCPGCDHGALDLTPSLFKDLAGSLGPGVIHGTWSFA